MFQEKNYPKFSDEWLINRFFKYGSIDGAMSGHEELVPFSYMSYYRKLTDAGIIRSPGRQTSFTEALHFFRIKQLEPGMPLESIYRELPPSFKTSINTLHRIYTNVERVIPGRIATALVISPASNPEQILVGKEVTGNRLYGKVAGVESIPMTFSHLKDNKKDSVLRVLQQEVFTKEAIEGKFSDKTYVSNLLTGLQGQFLKYRILDVEVRCFRLFVSDAHNLFSSYKLSSHRLVDASEIVSSPNSFRLGVSDIVKNAFVFPFEEKIEVSPLNLALIES